MQATAVAVLDDWQNVARPSADWTQLEGRAELAFFDEAFASEDEAARCLGPFDVVVAMRERTPFPASLIDRLPRLKMISVTGLRPASLDIEACARRGIVVSTTGTRTAVATAELALGLLLAVARQLPAGDAALRAGRFQSGVAPGQELEGKTLGIIGLGRIGQRMARYAQAMGMQVVAWSQNLTEEAAAQVGVRRVDKDELLRTSDAVSLHVVLSPRSRDLIAGRDIALMKPQAILINTSRAGLVQEEALLQALKDGRIRAGLDVFPREPVPAGNAWAQAGTTVLTPHLGYCTEEVFTQFYRESLENVLAFLAGSPVRVALPPEPVR